MTRIENPIDTIQPYEPTLDRQQQELINALYGRPQNVSIARPIEAVPHTRDTLSVAAPKATGIERSSVPPIDAPEKPLDAETFKKGARGLDSLTQAIQGSSQSSSHDSSQGSIQDSSDSQKRDYRSLSEDDRLLRDLSQIYSLRSDQAAVMRNMFNAERIYADLQEQERSDEIKKQVATNRSVGTWDTIGKSIGALTLIAASCACIATGFVPAPVGVAGIVFGTAILIDQILEERATKAMASWLAHGDGEQQRLWLDRIHTFTTCTSLIFSLAMAAPAGAANGFVHVARIGADLALAVSRGVSGGIKSLYEWRLSNQKAVMINLDFLCTIAQRNLNHLVQMIQELCDYLNKLNVDIHTIEEKLKTITSMILQLINKR